MAMAFNFFELSDEYMRVMQKDKQRKRTLYSRRIIISAADDDYTLSGKKLVSAIAELRSKKLPATQNKIWDTLRMYKKTKLAFQGNGDAQIHLISLAPSKHWLAIAYECLLKDGFETWNEIEEAGKKAGIYEKKSIKLKKVDASAKAKDANPYPVLEEIKQLINEGSHVKAYRLMRGVFEEHKRDRANLINCLDELNEANNLTRINEDLRLMLRQKEKENKTANEVIARQKKELEEVFKSLEVANNKIKELEKYIGGLKRRLSDLRKLRQKK